MAGGMRRGRGGVPLHQRVRAETRPAPDPDGDGPGMGRSAPPELSDGGRHCWVLDAVDRQGVKRPGLLLEWRRGTAGWEGRVVYTALVRPGVWAGVEEWLAAPLLEPA